MKKVIVGLCWVLVLSLAAPAFAKTIYVPTRVSTIEQASDRARPRGTSIQQAIDRARPGDTVLVDPGEYVESISLKSGVTVQSSGGPDVTIIRGDGSQFVSPEGYSYNYTVLGENAVAAISGFTITGSFWGVVIYGESATITNNIIVGNYHGIYNNISSAVIANNKIIGSNRYTGIGIYNNSGSTATITNNKIIGMWWLGINNSPGSSATITNNTIATNYAGITGWQAAPVILNNIVASNLRYGIDSSSGGRISYNNVWGSREANYGNMADQTGIRGNISADPLFEPVAGGYHLLPGSPCIDAGTGDAPGIQATDLDGAPRVIDGNGDGRAVVDMGAYEFQAAP